MFQKYFWFSALFVMLFFAGVALPASAAHPRARGALQKQPLSSGPLLVLENTTYSFPSQPTLAQASSAAAPMSEGFEGLWPGAGWQLNNGPYTWGRRSCHPYGGQFAGWSVGGGATGAGLACNGMYPNGANVWAKYGPFDLSNASSAQLRFFMWGKTQIGNKCEFDQFVALSSVQPPAPPTTTPLPGTPNYDGSWSGATIQGAPISFTIANQALTVLAYEYTIQGCGMGVRTEFGTPKALTGNTFTMQSTLHKILPLPPFTPYTVDVTVQGTFNSATSATGTMQVSDAFCGALNTTWTATKQ